jgi:Chs5-Arf1p-binding protein BUD7/BCH1
LLTRLVSQIGWDELLKTRSQVFVMEEEYRMQKTQGDIQRVLSATSTNGSSLGNAVIHEDGTVVRPSIDDQASTRGIKAPSPTIPTVSIADANGNDDQPVSAVPTIRISTESSRGNDSKEEENLQKKLANDDSEEKEEPESNTVDRKIEKGKSKEVYADDGQTDSDMPSANGVVQQNGIQSHGLEKPVQAAGEGDQNVNKTSPAPAQEPFSFSNKRLCERWLDNLFMVLYEVGYTSFLVSQIIQQQI